MTFTLQIFNDSGSLVTFVNAQAITAANITRIMERAGKWYLFYWV